MIQKCRTDQPVKNNGGVCPMSKDVHTEPSNPTENALDIVTINIGGSIYATSVVTNAVYKIV